MNSIKKYLILEVFTVLVISVLVVGNIVISNVFEPYPTNYLILIAVALVIFSVPFLFLIKLPKDKRNITKIIHLICICFILNYPIRAIYMIFKKADLTDLLGNIKYFNESLGIAILAGVIFYAAYYFLPASKKDIPFLLKAWDDKKLETLLICLYLFYFIIVIDLIGIRYFGLGLLFKSAFSVAFMIISQIIIALSAISYFKFNKSIKIFWFIILPVQIIMGFVLKMKEPILMVIIYFFVIESIVKKRINYKQLLLGLILLILLVSLIQPLRYGKLSELTNTTEFGSNLVKSLEYPFQRMHALDSLAIILNNTPEVHDFKHGETLMFLPYSFIPRVVWSDKPVIPLGSYFAKEYINEKIEASISVSILGDLYWNFGLISVIIGMLVFGFLFKLFSAKLEHGELTSSKIFLASIIAYYVFTDFVSEEMAMSFAFLVRVMTFAIVLIFLLNKRESDDSYKIGKDKRQWETKRI